MKVSACLVTQGDVVDRSMAKIELPAEPEGCWCWIWTGAAGGREGARYGRIFAGRRTDAGHPAAEQAHRIAYQLAIGPIPEGMEIDHLCRVTLCVNPDHLEAVTPLENQRRGSAPMQAQRKQTHCKRGHAFTPENTYSWRGMRRCRKCQADDARRYRSRQL